MNAHTKTAQELQTELTILEAELTSCNQLVASINRLSADVQRQTTQHALGSVSATELLEAQRKFDEATSAIARQGHLQNAVHEQKQFLKVTIGRERAALCDSIRDSFGDMNQRYAIESKKLLDLFVAMHNQSIKHLGLTGTPLLYQNDYKNLNLPAVRSANDSELFSTGDMVASGSIK